MTAVPVARLDHLELLQDAVARFASLVCDAQGDEPVAACRPWLARDLVVHLGTVHRWAAAIVLSGQRLPDPEPLVTAPMADWYAGTATALVSALHAVDPAEVVPNFARVDETAGFWRRRQLHEVTVHALDLEQAVHPGASAPTVPPAVAADGVDEVLRVFFPRLTARGRRPDVRSRVRLEAVDVDRSWIVSPGEGDSAPEILPATADADAVVSGSASDLYLALWHRVDVDRLALDGADGRALLAGPTTP